jgi:hypothetical protein
LPDQQHDHDVIQPFRRDLRDGFGAVDIALAFEPFRRELVDPRKQHHEWKSDHADPGRDRHHRRGQIQCRHHGRGNLDHDPPEREVSGSSPKDIAALQFGDQ